MVLASSVLTIARASRPSFTCAEDCVAFAVHAVLILSGRRLVAVGSAAEEEEQTESVEREDVGIDGWNELQGRYAFRYVSEGDEKEGLLMKCFIIADKVVVEAMPTPAQPTTLSLHIEIDTSSLVSKFDSPNFAEVYRDLEGLVESLNNNILKPLREQSGKKNQGTTAGTFSLEDSRSRRPSNMLEDELHSRDRVLPPAGIGAGDAFHGLMPPGGGTGGGMLLGPNDPYWNQMRDPRERVWRGGTPRGLPPGARYDPIGPPDLPGFQPDRFMRDRGYNPTRPSHPDLENFRDD